MIIKRPQSCAWLVQFGTQNPKNQLADKPTQVSCQHQPESPTAVLTFFQTSNNWEALLVDLQLSFFWISRPDWQLSGKRRRVWTAHMTGRAHTHIFLVERVTFHSCALRMAQDAQGEKSPRHHFALISISFFDVVAEYSSLFFPTSPIFTNRLTIQTFSVYNISGKKLQEKPCELAVGFLAEWLTQLQTQVVSPTPPTSSATWTRSTRRFTSPTETTISSAKTTPPWSPPLTLKVCRTQEHPAAASKQQQAEFLQFSDFQASGNRWQVMCLVDQASSKLWRFRTETLLQQRFLVHSRKGREIDNRCAFVERQSKSSKNPWTESWLGRPRRNNGSAKIVRRWGWGWGEKLGKEKFRLCFSGVQSRILRSAISTTPSKSIGRSGSERQDYLVWRI